MNTEQEHENIHDEHAITGYTRLPGTARTTVVGHIPRELSRYIWFAIELGAVVTGKVKSARYRLSPLLQGGLEIPVFIKVEWSNENALKILAQQVNKVTPLNNEYKDDSKEILNEILGADYDDNNAAVDDYEVDMDIDIVGPFDSIEPEGNVSDGEENDASDGINSDRENNFGHIIKRKKRIVISSDDDDDDQ